MFYSLTHHKIWHFDVFLTQCSEQFVGWLHSTAG